jgi:hypothetical protein
MIINFISTSCITRTDFFHLKHIDIDIIKTSIKYNYSLNDVFSLTNFGKTPIKKYELIGFVSSLTKISHFPIDFTYVVDNYREKIQGFYYDLLRIIYQDYDASILVDNYFNNVNNDLDKFTEYLKSYCLDTVHLANKISIFDEFELIARENPPKDPKAKENNFSKKTNSIPNAALLFSLGAAFATGEFIAPVTVIANMMSSSSSNHISNITSNLIDPELLFSYSKIFCINTFSLHFVSDFNLDTLTIVGDKINYEYLLDYISTIQYNVLLKKNKNKDTNTDINTLNNLWEKLEVIKIITIKMEEIVVFELYDKITELSKITSDPFLKIKDYISYKVIQLQQLKDRLYNDFPISNFNILEQSRFNAALRQINAKIKQETLLKNAEHLDATKFASDQRVLYDNLLNELFNNEFTAWVNLHIYSPIKCTAGLFTRTIMAVPQGVTIGGIQWLYDFLGSIWSIFFTNPITSLFITFVCLAIIYSTVVNVIQITLNFLHWIFFPLFFVFNILRRLF